jgi:hypothetical protein
MPYEWPAAPLFDRINAFLVGCYGHMALPDAQIQTPQRKCYTFIVGFRLPMSVCNSLTVAVRERPMTS